MTCPPRFASCAPFVVGQKQGSQTGDAVAGRQTRRDKLPERILGFAWKTSCHACDVDEERGPVAGECGEHFVRGPGEIGRCGVVPGAARVTETSLLEQQ